MIVDNNEEQEDDGQIFNSVFKQIKPLAKSKPTSKIAQLWIKKELEMKKDNNTTEEINFARKNFMNLDSKRLTLKDSFDFSIETIGIYSNKTLLIKANEILINRINEFKEKFENKKVIINK